MESLQIRSVALDGQSHVTMSLSRPHIEQIVTYLATHAHPQMSKQVSALHVYLQYKADSGWLFTGPASTTDSD